MLNYDHDNKYRKVTIIENQGSFSATEQMRTLPNNSLQKEEKIMSQSFKWISQRYFTSFKILDSKIHFIAITW